ncbi:MAG: GLPGLI family protein, partial [Flavobacteriaceae bacterium]|nr:GLPGLI family protein [Flavobacteriaceae bacterium]
MSLLYMRYSALKVVLCLFFLGIIPSLYAQTAYKVTYYIAEPKMQGSLDNLDEKGKHFTKQVIARAKDVNYILIANQDESYFEREDILRIESDSPFEHILLRTAQRFVSFNERIYANHKEDSIIFVKKLVNHDFTVKRGYFNFNWIIKDDNKKILGFDAKKAEGNYYNPVT